MMGYESGSDRMRNHREWAIEQFRGKLLGRKSVFLILRLFLRNFKFAPNQDDLLGALSVPMRVPGMGLNHGMSARDKLLGLMDEVYG